MVKVLSLFILLINPVLAKEFDLSLIKISYLKNIFGHIHQNPSSYSTSMTTLSCGHPIKVYNVTLKNGKKSMVFGAGFNYVSAGSYYGYIQQAFLVDKKPVCFQDKYPKFFDEMDLNITELYYWGRLYDHYSQGKSTIR